MQPFDLFSFRQKIIENNIILSFEGKMSQGVLTALIDALKEKIATDNVDSANSMQYTTRKIYSILVELAQNIQNHSLEQVLVENGSTGLGIIAIRENETCFSLTSGNNLLISDAEKLAEYCCYLNSLDEKELKKLYKEKLKQVRKKPVKGGGIGLIEVKRKSDRPLEYNMKSIDNETTFFSLSVNLAKAS